MFFPSCFTTHNQVAAMAIVKVNCDQECWLCMDNIPGEKTKSLCKCPGRYAHKTCMAKWQLQCLGKSEEKYCRFCNVVLPNWRESYPIDKYNMFTPDITIKLIIHDKELVVKLKPNLSNYAEKFVDAIREQLGVNMTNVTTNIQLSTVVDGIEIKSSDKESLNAILYLAAYNAQHRCFNRLTAQS